jgi:N-acetylmuramoyl-L-alanine amidase
MIKVNGKFKSCNFSPRPPNTSINTLVIHHTDMTSAEGALNRLRSKEIGVSCHYLIGRSGEVYQLVDDLDRAYHAGESSWRGKEQVNDFSLGIELDNNGVSQFAELQIESLIALSQNLMKKFPIEPRNIVAHADIAPNRKIDPNMHFNWKLLADHHVGIYPEIQDGNPKVLFKFGMQSNHINSLKRKFAQYGYQIKNPNDEFDRELLNIVHAFKRHFCIETYDHIFWDTLADARLGKLLNMVK